MAADAATRSTRRAWWSWPWVLATLAACLLFMLPDARAMAQHLWEIIWVGRVAMVTMDVDKLPASLTATRISVNVMSQKVASPEEAATLARFAPRIPDPAVMAGDRPAFAVIGPMTFETTVKATDLQAALDREGIVDRSIPPEWDGAKLTVHTSALVTAGYGDLQLTQCLPLAITTPPGFDFGAFAETILRIVGLSPNDARTFAAQLVKTPMLIFPIEPDEEQLVRMRRVRLRTAQGTLLHDFDDDGGVQRIELFWSVSDRIYAISAPGSMSEERVVEIANAIP